MGKQTGWGRWIAGVSVAALMAGGWVAQAARADAGRPDVEYHPHPNSAFPFSRAVRVGELVFLSGQIGIDYSTGKLVEGFEAQSRRTMDNIKADLEAIGLGMDDVVKCTLMIADMSRWPEFNQIYATYFRAGRLPARSALGVSGLAMGAEVEVECIAATDRK